MLRLVAAAVSFVILKGVVTQARSHGWRPVRFAAAATMPIILCGITRWWVVSWRRFFPVLPYQEKND